MALRKAEGNAADDALMGIRAYISVLTNVSV
jgi:hypothetical protein